MPPLPICRERDERHRIFSAADRAGFGGQAPKCLNLRIFADPPAGIRSLQRFC
jgi:hypothetical protein